MRKILAGVTALVAGVALFFAAAEPAEAATCNVIRLEVAVLPVIAPIVVCI